ncbi:MAG: hypothetical protein EXR68_01515 [Dehalococcoidia bacterium]|nr:hypothetical protein [Dehalococcoidia bacterium]
MNAAFLRHYVEMLVSMLAGMMVFGATSRSTLSLFGAASILDSASVWAMLMATYMTAGMSLWMWYRGHRWLRIAMCSPFVLLLVPLRAGLISAHGLNLGGHLLMLLTMLSAMLLRREEYSHDHS